MRTEQNITTLRDYTPGVIMSLIPWKEEDKVQCPKCFVKMDKRKVEVFGPDITVDTCPECKGTWLDPGELKRVLKNNSLADYLSRDIGTRSESKLICPGCGGLMDLERYDDIEVDVCLDCNGVWLDEGELNDLRSVEERVREDKNKKAEKWEDSVARNRNSTFNRLMRRLFG